MVDAVANAKTTFKSMSRVEMAAGAVVILSGFVCYWMSTIFDQGFVHGLFQGATIAQMVIGTYLIGASMRHAHEGDETADDGGLWLPSRDDAEEK